MSSKTKSLIILLLVVFTQLFFITLQTNSTAFPDPSVDDSNSVFQPASIHNESFLNHKMEVKVLSDLGLKITSTFVLANNNTSPLTTFNFTIEERISSLICYDPLGSLFFDWEISPNSGNNISIALRYPLLPGEFYVLSVSYEMTGLIYQIDSPAFYFALDFQYAHLRDTTQFILQVSLPIYHTLISQTSPAPVSPTPDEIFTEDQVVSVLWIFDAVTTDAIDLFAVKFQPPQETPSAPTLLWLYLLLAFLTGIAVSSLTLFIIYRYKFQPGKTSIVTSLLSDSEQAVIASINEDGGISTQRRICEHTGYSKSKVSQILKKLEEKDVLTRERWGRTNKVTLQPSFRTIGNDQSAD